LFRRRIISRLVKSVTYLKENRTIEVVLVLSHPDVPLRLTAPDDLAPSMVPERRDPDRQCPLCPGPGADRIHTS